ncbi:MAG: hypothetical protein DBX55_02730 [Verrucomicrobia bacterium]|nr:MAG: hypothetical protein DBX55_02730 [Verrucomicrobiota bacterium]
MQCGKFRPIVRHFVKNAGGFIWNGRRGDWNRRRGFTYLPLLSMRGDGGGIGFSLPNYARRISQIVGRRIANKICEVKCAGFLTDIFSAKCRFCGSRTADRNA